MTEAEKFFWWLTMLIFLSGVDEKRHRPKSNRQSGQRKALVKKSRKHAQKIEDRLKMCDDPLRPTHSEQKRIDHFRSKKKKYTVISNVMNYHLSRGDEDLLNSLGE